MVAAAVGAAEILRHVGDVGLMRRIVGFSAAQLSESYAPAAFASLGVASAIAVTRRELRRRLDAAGVLGAAGGWRRRVAPLVVGRLEPAPERQP